MVIDGAGVYFSHGNFDAGQETLSRGMSVVEVTEATDWVKGLQR